MKLRNIQTGDVAEHYQFFPNSAFAGDGSDFTPEWLADNGYELFIEQSNPLSYTQKRAAEYPSFLDYIDGIVKGDQAQVQGYIDACLAVKAKYPKE